MASPTEKTFWTFTIGFTSLMMLYLMYGLSAKFIADKIITRLSNYELSVGEVPFPALTICPELINQDRLAKYADEIESLKQNLTDQSNTFVDILELLHDANAKNLFSYSNGSIYDFLNSTHQIEWITMNLYGLFRTRFAVLFKMTLTKWGFCFTFNMVPLSEFLHLDTVSLPHTEVTFAAPNFDFRPVLMNDEAIPWRSSETGSHMVVSMRKNGTELNSLQVKSGWLFILHRTDEFPSESSFQFRHNYTYTKVTVKPELELLSDGLKTANVEARNCLFNDEMPLKFFKIYSKLNCEHECQSLMFSKHCDCVPFYLLKTAEDKTCSWSDRPCIETITMQLRRNKSTCYCLDRCEAPKYRFRLLQFYSSYDPFFLQYEENFFQPIERVRALPFSEFLASAGGVLGLTAGLSVVSLIELAFLCYTKLKFRKKFRVVHVLPRAEIQNESEVESFKLNQRHALYQLHKYFVEFLSRSDAHGAHLMVGKSKLSLRLFWTFSFVGSIMICSLAVIDTVQHSETNPVMIAIDSKFWRLEDLEFPAITFCPEMDRQLIERHEKCIVFDDCVDTTTQEAYATFDAVMPFCSRFKFTPLQPENETIRLPMIKKLERYIRIDWIRNQNFCFNQQPNVTLTPILTNHGLCYTFNAGKNRFNREIVSEDFLSEDSVSINCKDRHEVAAIQSLTVDYRDEAKKTCVGVFGSIYMHHKGFLPGVVSGYILSSTVMRFIVVPEITSTDESVRTLTPKQRGCYFEDERNLMFYKKYSKENCISECRSNYSIEVCGCIRFDIIRSKSNKICMERESFSSCTHRVINTLNFEENPAFQACDCLPSCNSVEYKFNIINEDYDFETNSSSQIASSISIYFGDDEFVGLKRYATHGTVGLLSNIGGLLGLFLGISALSLVEAFYYFTLRFLNDFCWIERRKK